MAMRIGGGEFASDINVTPLVDVMLVLLVIFMITAPMMNTGVEIALPETEAAQVEEKQDQLILSIDANHRLFLDGTAISWVKLHDKLKFNDRLVKEKRTKGQSTLYVEGHKEIPYAVVVTAMAVAKDAGVDRVLMMTDPSTQVPLEKLDAKAADAPGAPQGPPAGGGDGQEQN